MRARRVHPRSAAIGPAALSVDITPSLGRAIRDLMFSDASLSEHVSESCAGMPADWLAPHWRPRESLSSNHEKVLVGVFGPAARRTSIGLMSEVEELAVETLGAVGLVS
jgi:hypothetical protein